MCFHIVNLIGSDASPGQRLHHDPLLSPAAGNGDGKTRPGLAHRRPSDDAPNPIAVGLGIAQPLQHHNAASLAADIAVGRGVKRLALPLRRQHVDLDQCIGDRSRQDDVHAPHQGHIGLPSPKALHRLVYGKQRRRAGQVQRHCRSFHAQRESHLSHGHASRGVEMAAGSTALLDDPPVFADTKPDIQPAAASLQTFGIDSGILNRLPAGLQQHPLERINRPGLSRRHPEELRIKGVEALDERTPAVDGIVGRRIAEDSLP